MKRTRFYPKSKKDRESGLHVLRGPICKLCTHKFFVYEKVLKVENTITSTHVSIAQMKRDMVSTADSGKVEVDQEQENEHYNAIKI